MKKTVVWVVLLLFMAIGAGCATTSSDLSYDKVVKQEPGMAGTGDLNPNWRK